jgi:hypothetical protein
MTVLHEKPIEFRFPTVYYQANKRAANYQKLHFLFLFLVYASLFLASSSAISDGIFGPKIASILYLIFIVVGVSAIVVSRILAFQKAWYSARALAESTKTLCWRYALCAEPFDQGGQVQIKLGLLFDELMESHENTKGSLARLNDESKFPTEIMDNVRNWTFEQKKEYYLSDRISDQHEWYEKKALLNATLSRIFFWTIIFSYTIGFCWAVAQLNIPSIEIRWISEPVLVLAAGLVGYSESKRFNELSASYNLAKYEIGKLKDEFTECESEAELLDLIDDAEQAFSREHTQWIARRA